MPELPEVETMVRGIRPAVEGRVVVDMRRCRCPCRPLSMKPRFEHIKRRVRGQRISRIERLAKRIVLRLESGDACVIEPRMTGLMLLNDPPDRGHLRLEWSFEGTGQRLWFWDRRGLGTVRLYTADEFTAELGPQRLGRDALSLTVAELQAMCTQVRRPIKMALLDQKLIAGIGNLYASEILHRAGIHPARRTDTLAPPQIHRLHAAVNAVLEQAIALEGSTLGDGTYRNALNQNGSYQNQHRVYAKAGEPCPRCRQTTIQRIVQAQRSTFFCDRCQR